MSEEEVKTPEGEEEEVGEDAEEGGDDATVEDTTEGDPLEVDVSDGVGTADGLV